MADVLGDICSDVSATVVTEDPCSGMQDIVPEEIALREEG